MSGRVLLVAPPWRLPYTASLSLATLSPIVRAAGMEVDELHGTVLFPVTATSFDFLDTYAKYLFVRELNNTSADDLIKSLLNSLSRNTLTRGTTVPAQTWEAVGIQQATVEANFRADLQSAERCLDAMTERALAKPYDIVGFSTTFDSQVPASLALARRIRRARPETRIVFGGAACFEEQGDGLIAAFSDVDAVCHTEGESVIVPLFQALATGASLASVPGISWRDGARVVHNPPPTLLRDLDTLPMPDYRGFMSAFEESHWSADSEPLLMFETSRGCWWGQKKLCTFCGLNAEGIAFRAKTPQRAYEEIVHLYETYPRATYLQATDNILDMKYLTEVFPKLHELARRDVRPLRMFYEVKSNMKAEHVRAMALAGVDCVQPGIESFSDEILKLMNKGCTALGQIQFIKWSYEEHIDPKYNVIVSNPGERAEWYEAMTSLVPYISHLPPPTGIVNMQLERFSPYFQEPERYGITNVRPQSFYRELYPGVDLDRIAYQFEFEHPDHQNPALSAAILRFVVTAQAWRARWTRDMLFYRFDERDDRLVVVDRRGKQERVDQVEGLRARLFVFLDQHRTRTQIAELFSVIESILVDALLETWLHRRWICQVGDRFVNVVPRKGAPRNSIEQEEPVAQPRRRANLPMVA